MSQALGRERHFAVVNNDKRVAAAALQRDALRGEHLLDHVPHPFAGEINVEHSHKDLDVEKVPCALVAEPVPLDDFSVLGHLLADRAKLLTHDHFRRVCVDHVAVELVFLLVGGVFVPADVNRELGAFAKPDGFAPHGRQIVLDLVRPLLGDQLELDQVSPPERR